MKIKFSDELKRWLNSFSQSAAVDMCEGGDDAECVAETTLTCIDIHNKNLCKEVDNLVAKHGYRAVLKETVKHVCTL